MKECIKCNVNKPDSAFYRRGSSGSLYSYCRTCVSTRSKKYYAANKAFLKGNSAKYYENNREGIKYKRREYVQCNAELVRSGQRRYREENRAVVSARVREHYSRNKERVKLQVKTYKKNNPNRTRLHNINRSATKRQRSSYGINELDIFVLREAAALAVERERVIGFKWHVDHIEPLRGTRVSGLHNAFNIAVTPATYNLRKNNKQAVSVWGWV